MAISTEGLLETMFAVHGKRPLKAQFSEYLKVFDILGVNSAEKVFEHVRDHEDKFPTIKQLWGTINSLGLNRKRNKQSVTYADCYYCGGVGYVPYLLSPKRDKRATNYFTEVYACKCDAGESLPQTFNRYFTVFKELQFNEEMDGYNYPQLVTHLQREYASELYKEKNDGATYKKSDSKFNSPLGERNLGEGLKAIAVRSFKDEV
jgi:hypothetical protein